MEQMLGYPAAEITPDNLRIWTHPDDRDTFVLRDEFDQEKRESYDVEKRYIRADGETIWCRVVAEHVRDGDKPGRSAISLFEDITERKLAELALRKQTDRLSQIVEIQRDVAAADLDLQAVMTLICHADGEAGRVRRGRGHDPGGRPARLRRGLRHLQRVVGEPRGAQAHRARGRRQPHRLGARPQPVPPVQRHAERHPRKPRHLRPGRRPRDDPRAAPPRRDADRRVADRREPAEHVRGRGPAHDRAALGRPLRRDEPRLRVRGEAVAGRRARPPSHDLRGRLDRHHPRRPGGARARGESGLRGADRLLDGGAAGAPARQDHAPRGLAAPRRASRRADGREARDSYRYEKRYVRKDGELVWCQLTAVLERDSRKAARAW